MLAGYIIIIIISAVTVLLFNYSNSYRKIERFYYNKNKSLFLLLELCVLILVLSFLYHIRFIILNLMIIPWMKAKIRIR